MKIVNKTQNDKFSLEDFKADFNELDNDKEEKTSIGNVQDLYTVSKVIVGAINETYKKISDTSNGVLEDRVDMIDEQLKHVKAEDIKTTKYSVKKALFTLSDDDGRLEALTVLKPILDAKGFKAGSCIITNNVGGTNYMTWEQIKILSDAGWEIMSHTKSHAQLYQLTDAQQIDEIVNSQQILKSKGYECKGIVFPYGSADERAKSLANKYYKYGFQGWGPTNVPINSINITRYTIGEDENLTLANFKSYVDKAIAEKSWMVLCSHIGTLSANQLQILRDLIDYIATKTAEISVVTPSEGYEIFGNSMESRNYASNDYFCVSKTGIAYSSGINTDKFVQFLTDNSKLPTDLMTTYPTGLSAMLMSKATALTFGLNDAGVLYTYKFGSGNAGMNYQIFHEVASKNIYFRQTGWSGEWTAWGSYNVKTQKTYSMPTQTVPANSTLDLNIYFGGVRDHHMLHASPGIIEAGVGWVIYYYSNDNVILRLTNPTTSSKSLAARDWKLTFA